MGKISYLSAEDLLEINKIVVERFGGTFGIKDKGTIEFTIDHMKIPKNLYRKAAVLMRNIITGHAFLDGNKRTGFESMKVFLELNGKLFILEDEKEIINAVVKMAKGEMKIDAIQKWIETNSR